MNRDEYVENMKQQIDAWNDRIAQWEERIQKLDGDLRAQYQTQIESLRQQSDVATQKLRSLQQSSDAAWQHMSHGLEGAWKTLAESFEKSLQEFNRTHKP